MGGGGGGLEGWFERSGGVVRGADCFCFCFCCYWKLVSVVVLWWW